MRFFPFVCVLVLFVSCQKDASPGGGGNSLAATTSLNLSYGSDPLQKMDMYLPAGRSSTRTPSIIMIHGGAWMTGDKSDFNAYVDTLKKRLPDYAIFNLNYRLAAGTSNLFPTQENDIKAAYNFITARLNDYAVSDKLVLLGASAGGHLALLQGYKNSGPLAPKAIIDFFGPTDLANLHDHPGDPAIATVLELLLAGTPATQASLYQQSSPIQFVTSQSAPTLILQGGVDPLVPAAQSAALDAALQAKGVTRQYVFYPTEGHGWLGANLRDSFDKIQQFLTANVH